MSEVAVLGIDLGKNSCSVVGVDRRRARWFCGGVWRATASPALLAKLPPCVVAMEACCGAHHLGRGCGAQGHRSG